MDQAVAILVAALLLDITIGDPKYPLHPVKLMGIVISAMERFFLRIGFFTGFSGVLLIVTLQTAFVGTCWIVGEVLQGYRWFFLLFMTYSLLALKDLIEHAQRVVKHLQEEKLPKARRSVAMMVAVTYRNWNLAIYRAQRLKAWRKTSRMEFFRRCSGLW